jgi:hypothetical protein
LSRVFLGGDAPTGKETKPPGISLCASECDYDAAMVAALPELEDMPLDSASKEEA